ncbi:Phenol hydroxylase [Paramyrothecium foliicola]|nr:Phenol hydroxylase [Paramyrothecium foliicola]
MSTQQQVAHYDIVIVGAGPVGLMLSTCLARWGYKIKHIDNRPEPTKTGRADGIQPRSLDLLKNMGLKQAIMAHKPARVYEVAFWDPSPSNQGIVRTGTWASCPSFIDARYPFTTLLHQGLIERAFIADLEKHGVEVQRPWTIKGFHSDEAANPQYPVEVDIAHVDNGTSEKVRAKYLFSGEGARSFVRQQLNIGFQHKDPISHVWGVMDGVVKTDFPDIKMKCTIHSEHGSIMVIPRENKMVRLYIQIASSTDADWDPRKTASESQVQQAAKRILHPYSIEWETVEWYSVYPIGQGIAQKYTLDERVFLGGDACHTHSPKAGQGMNTAFLDAQNLAWKIHAVESGFAKREILKTYETERKNVAEMLLDFDNRYARLFSQRPPAATEVQAASENHGNEKEQDNDFIKTFKESCEFTSGYGVYYKPNALNWSPSHTAQSPLIHPEGTKLVTGRLFIVSDVTRVVDANVVHLEQEIPLNGSFRIFVFGGNPSKSREALQDFSRNLERKSSFYAAYTRDDIGKVTHHEQNNPHSHFYTICTIFAAKRSAIEISRDVPTTLARYRDHVYADDRFDWRFPQSKASAHAKMGFDEDEGGVVVVRPDGYVGIVVRLVRGNGTANALDEYFSSFVTKPLAQRSFNYTTPASHSSARRQSQTNSDVTAPRRAFRFDAPEWDFDGREIFQPSSPVCFKDKMSYSAVGYALIKHNANLEYFRPTGLREPRRSFQPRTRPRKRGANCFGANRFSAYRFSAVPPSPSIPETPPHASSERSPYSPAYECRKTVRPRAQFLIDTKYPTEEDYYKHSPEAVRDVHWSRCGFRRPRVRKHKLRVASAIIQPDFVTIDGTRTLKRRAQDTEFDLVATSQGLEQSETIVTSRTGNTDHELPQSINQSHSMRGLFSVRGHINKMMSCVRAAFSNAGEALQRLINPRAYDVAELRSFVAGNVSNKRLKLTSQEQEKIVWKAHADVGDAVDAAAAFRSSFALIAQALNLIGGNKTLSASINRALRPLRHVLVDNDSAGNSQHGAELRTLYLHRLRQLDTFLDKIYSYPFLAKLKDRNTPIPPQVDYGTNDEDIEIVTQIKKFLSAPALPTATESIMAACRIQTTISMNFMDLSILDLEAMTQGMALPSMVASTEYLAKWQHTFPRPQRTDIDHLGLPGGFPQQPDDPVDEVQPNIPSPPPSASCDSPKLIPTPPASPPPVIAKTQTNKSAFILAKLDAIEISQITAGQFRTAYYKESSVHNLIKDKYVDEFTPKEPLKPGDIHRVVSILKSRQKDSSKRSPKRLHIARAPKTVRFVDSTLSPQPRSHTGLGVPRLNVNGEAPVAQPLNPVEPFISTPRKATPRRIGRWTVQEKEEPRKGDFDARIREILSQPSFKPLFISNDTRADIALEKEQAALKAAEEARRAAEEARLAAEQKARQELEERLAKTGGLRIPEQTLVQPVTDEWRRRAQETLRASATTILAQTPEGVEIRRHDFQKVVPSTEWLNDEIVNGSLIWLDQAVNSAAGIKDVRRKTRKCLSMNSFFFKRLREQGVARTERTMRRNGVEKNNFLDVNTIFLPICERSHWTLLVIRPGKRTVAHMDSLNPRGSSEYTSLALAWVKEFLGDKFKEQEWKVANHEAPLQTNGHDCGVHTITNAMCIALGLNPIDSYSSDDMPLQRIRIACMFLNGGFKDEFDLRVY